MRDLSGYVLTTLQDDGEFALYRGRPANPSQAPAEASSQVLVRAPIARAPTPAILERLEHEYALASELDPLWAARPLALVRHEQRTMLVLEDPGGEPIAQVLDRFSDLTTVLRAAVALAGALGKVHQRGLIHKDIKPANVLLDATGHVWLTGFGIASRLPRERQEARPPEIIAGTLAYMAPEQTGRMNRSIDSRSDLYSLGVTLYELLTKTLPFAADDPLEWVHCHIARQPVPLRERATDIPPPLCDVVMKLLAKTAEERYQTAAGLVADLRHCLAEWESKGRIDPFSIGAQDASDRLLIPERLYGREREIDALLATFDQVVTDGTPGLVLVSGYAGIGKSSLVHELHKALVPSRGLFAAGKFDQGRRDIPYATIAQAFHTLIGQILGKNEAEVRAWRDALRHALEPNGQLIVNLIPALEFIVGPQPPVPELPAPDAQHRFQAVFQRFLAVFARRDHPLVLFLDDLQWLDAATLALIERLLTGAEVEHLLLIGAYRDSEVGPSHPLVRTVAAIRAAGARVRDVVLAALDPADVERLVADALHCPQARAAPLARMLHEKTGGNPFFASQFLTALAEEDLLTFDPDAMVWTWDLARIRARRVADNVVDLLVSKLTRLPADTQDALKQLACLGNRAQTTMLRVAHDTSESAVHEALWEAVRAGLVFRVDDGYIFLHDRVQEVAYGSIPEHARAERHLAIGRRLAANLPNPQRDEVVFELATQFNRGAALIDSRTEREQAANLDLMAGRRARAATDYVSALNYFSAGAALLGEDDWTPSYPLTFALEFERADCEFLTGALGAAETRLFTLARRATTPADRAKVTCLRVVLYTTLDRPDRAIEVGLHSLRETGIDWPPHPTEEMLREEYAQIWQRLGSRPIEALVDLPLMHDPQWHAAMDMLTEIITPAVSTDARLVALIAGRMTNLSLEHGNNDASSFAYVHLALVLGAHFGDYRAGFRFGRLALELVDTRRLDGFRARVLKQFGAHVVPWTQHLRGGLPIVRQAFDEALARGDITFAAYSCNAIITLMLASGEPLADVQREAEHAIAFARTVGLGRVIDILTTQLGLVRTLRGLTPRLGTFDERDLEEQRFAQRLAEDQRLVLPACWYWIRKLQARVLSGDYEAALDAADRARPLLWVTTPFFEVAEYHFYAALARAASCRMAAPDQKGPHQEALAAHHRQLEAWAQHCTANFEDRSALVAAEIAHIEGRELEAERLYEQAIRAARDNGFVHHEAFANELAARFHAARGFATIAQAYLRNARDGYVRWGAEGKVRQLDARHPQLRDELSPVPTTIGTPVEHLDLATVIKVSQAVSGEIVLEQLLDTLMRTALAHAGAERGLLIMPRDGELRVEADATTSGNTVTVGVREAPVSAADLPQSILQYVVRTKESVILDDASTQNPFSSDAYLCQHHARSVLCLPLIKQATLIGVFYLENGLTPHVFTPARIAVLKLLASQAAISLENTRLYSELGEREAKIRRLVDSNIIGILFSDLEGGILEANDAFLEMVGYSRNDLVSGRVRWLEMTPAQWLDVSHRARAQLRATGTCEPFEKEYVRKDGSRVPVLVGAAAVHEGRDESVAFVLDLTERKRTEAQLQEVTGRLITAQEEERRRVGRELHDHISQLLGLLAISIDRLLISSSPLPPALVDALGDLRQQTSVITADVHGLSHQLHSTIIDHLGLVPAVKRLISDWSARHGIRSDFTHRVMSSAVSPEVALCLYRVAEESLANIAKHSGAKTARVEVTGDGGGIGISIEDDGLGFQPDTLETKAGLGLISMRERLRIVGGTIRVQSVPSRGTHIDAWVPTMPGVRAPTKDQEYDRNRSRY